MEETANKIQEKAKNVKNALARFKYTISMLKKKHRQEMKELKDQAVRNRLKEIQKKING